MGNWHRPLKATQVTLGHDGTHSKAALKYARRGVSGRFERWGERQHRTGQQIRV
jgi:hypothetical protein